MSNLIHICVSIDDKLHAELKELCREMSEENNRRVTVSELLRVGARRLINSVKK